MDFENQNKISIDNIITNDKYICICEVEQVNKSNIYNNANLCINCDH